MRILNLPESTQNRARRDRIAGCLFGSAIGDAMGAAFEFVPSDAIERHVGRPMVAAFVTPIRSSLLYGRAGAQPTDDTAMAFCIATTLIRVADPSAADFARDFLDLLVDRRSRFAEMFWGGAPGAATTRALARLERGAAAENNGDAADGGNGAAMRAHPVGFLSRRDDVLAVAARQARVTHGEPSAVAAAQAVSVLVYDALAGAEISANLPRGIDDRIFAAAWQRAHASLALEDGRLPRQLRDVAMSGWETVAAAHAIAFCFPNDSAGAIGAAAASGGDTDTVAAIVGAIVGARYGLSALPKHLCAGLTCARDVETFAETLSACTHL